MSKIIKFLFAVSAVLIFTLILAGQAHAQAASGCVSGSWVNAAGNGTPTTLNVTNKTTCGAKQVSLCSYRVYIRPNAAGWLSTQTLFDSQVVTLQPGQTMTMSVNTDTCMNQVDAYEGPCVNPFVSDTTSVPYIFAGRMTDYTDLLCVKCTNECTVVGQRECSANGYRECEKGPSGCLKWGTVTNCAANEACNNGSCIPTCTNQCTSGDHQCSLSSGRTCGFFNSSVCSSWGTWQDCDSKCFRCGDGRCDCGETKSSCSQDCGHVDICSETLSGSPTSGEQAECANAGGQIQCGNGWCKCNCVQNPTVDLRSSGSVSCNHSATLTWTSTNATSCAASNAWSGSKGTSGSESVGNFTGTKTFTLTCTNSKGSVDDSVTLTGSSDDLEVSAGPDKEVYDSNSVRLNGTVDGDYDSLSWSCDGGILSDNDIEDPTWRPNFYSYSYDGFGDSYNYDRTFTCKLTAHNECGSDYDSMTIRVRRQNDPANFNVSLVTRPQSECAPLNGVDLTATVSNYGTYNDDYYYNSSYSSNYGYTYYFDCENDGNWDKTVTSNDTTYTAYDVCDYRNVGNYTAKVRVDSRGRTATDTEIVSARNCQTPELVGRVNIQKWVRNLTDGTDYQASAIANPAEVVSYKIIVTGVQGMTSSISVSDAMPAGIANIRDLQIDGNAVNGSLATGINIGNLAAGQTRIITYTATVAGENNFTYGQTALTNTATVITAGGSANAAATVYVYRHAVQGATTVSTGFDANMFAGIGLAIAGAVLALFFLARRVLLGKKLTPEAELSRKIGFIKRNDLA